MVSVTFASLSSSPQPVQHWRAGGSCSCARGLPSFRTELCEPVPAWDAQHPVSVTCTHKPAACNSPLGIGIGLRYQGEVLGIVFMDKPQPLYTWQVQVASVHCSSAQLHLLQQKSTFCIKNSEWDFQCYGPLHREGRDRMALLPTSFLVFRI